MKANERTRVILPMRQAKVRIFQSFVGLHWDHSLAYSRDGGPTQDLYGRHQNLRPAPDPAWQQ